MPARVTDRTPLVKRTERSLTQGLELFEEASDGGELSLVLKVAGGSNFLAAANESMTAAEQDQVSPGPGPAARRRA